ncbi:hypothetical protein [Pricia sp.]|uniref:hypothetical protein n=1 Tax=Pricia sp. TaxID=2268138 RepID=UPI003592F698
MKKYLDLITSCVGFLGVLTLSAQESNYVLAGEGQAVKKYTIMERFEPELILTSSERERLKAERFTEIRTKMDILDTMDISERKREKLINDLIESPFSPRLFKTFADIKFGEDE